MKFAVKLFVFAAFFAMPVLFAAENGVSIMDYENAALAGDAKAQYNLAFCYLKGADVTQSDTEAFKWFMKSAEQGYPHAECMVALCYTYGKGVKLDEKKALEYFKKAAAKDIAEAYFNIGWFNERGKAGLAKDEDEAKKWYKKAADKEHGAAKDALTRLQQAKDQQNNREMPY